MESIVELDSREAVTLFSSIEVVRSNPREELGSAELENQISEAIWQLYNAKRTEVAPRLGVGEVDVLLTDARVMGVKIDGHSVFNPRGFSGSKLEFFLAITMVKRESFTPSAYILEGGGVRAYLLARKAGVDEGLYFEIGRSRAAMYSIHPLSISHVADFDWGIDSAVVAVQEAFGVGERAASEIYMRYARGEVSKHVCQELESVFYGAFSGFVKDIADELRGLSIKKLSPMYLRSHAPIPKSIYEKRFVVSRRRITFRSVETGGDLADFINDDIHTVYAELNQLAKRRIRWLMPTT